MQNNKAHMKTIFILFLVAFFGSFAASAQSAPATTKAQDHIRFQPDKAKHFAAGAFVASSVQAVIYRITDNRAKALLIGVGSGIAAGAAKEFYDMTGRGNVSTKDFLWTAAGAGIASISLHYSIGDKHRKPRVSDF